MDSKQRIQKSNQSVKPINLDALKNEDHNLDGFLNLEQVQNTSLNCPVDVPSFEACSSLESDTNFRPLSVFPVDQYSGK